MSEEIIKDKSTVDIHPKTLRDISSSTSTIDSPPTVMVPDFTSSHIKPIDYLHMVSPHIPKDLISTENYEIIKNLAQFFTGNITSFFGFESRLADPHSKSDFLFAISSKGEEKEQLLQFLEENESTLFEKNEWRQIHNFTLGWVNNRSPINKNVLGLWLEFDTGNGTQNYDVPNIFMQIKKTRIDTPEDEKEFQWATKKALPLILGRELPTNIEKNVINSIKKLPDGTSLIHIGAMISRENNGIRLVINKIKPDQIIPYLQSIGCKDDSKELTKLIADLEEYVNRFVLHINIKDTIDPKIGIECSYLKDNYHLETKWQSFFTYLEEKNLCTTEKKKAIMDFIGAEYNQENEGNFDSFMVAPKINIDRENVALVRYISHVKITYKPGSVIEAKAYPGIRLFGMNF